MSHRVTTQTEIKDADLAKDALKAAGLGFREQGTSLYITSGSLANAVIDLRSGLVTGDTDYGHRSEAFGALKQFYSEAKYKKELSRQGGYVESRQVDKNGDIVLMCMVS